MDKDKSRNDLMRYDLRLQEALRGAVRTIMNDIARTGFPGDHHFYVSFRTTARGVQMSDRLRKQYPDEMTIVLQHQFWDLVIGEKEFSVGLSFKQIPEKLVIPFAAITSFVDPSVQFALKFEVDDAIADPAAPARPTAPQPLTSVDRNEPLQDKGRDDKGRAPRRLTPKAGATGEVEKTDAPPPPAEGQDGEARGGKIVSIDAFRKKP